MFPPLDRQHDDHHPQDLRWTLHGFLEVAYSQKSDLITEPSRLQNWTDHLEAPSHSYFPRQVHGCKVETLTKDLFTQADSQTLICDGLLSSLDVCLGVWGSDCPGLVISCGDGTFGIAHCGWRGTAQEMPKRIVENLSLASPSPRYKWQALIGPGICKNCYEVDEPVLGAYPWPKTALSQESSHHAHLDLKEAIFQQILQLGIKHITVSPICTAEDSRLHSFRRYGAGPNQGLLVWKK